jgi:hypothetical protein
VTTAQVLFSVALGLISLIIVSFAVYVVWTTTWGDRWVSKTNQNKNHRPSENA